ncbi:hypothetical protein BJ912DRAFT_942624 [Pholiota molesta]|nr:hypothetical protein BJ912DRAFT_942624 [Pholiota molesta]
MTSRVQKGSTVFRPVAKSRSRIVPTASRQPSVAVEQFRASSGSYVLPGADFPAPSLPSSSSAVIPPIPIQDQHGTVEEQRPISALSDATVQQEKDVRSQAIPSRNPSVPPIVGSSTNIVRSRSAVPTVIATPTSSKPPPRQSFAPTLQSSYDQNASSSATLVSENVVQKAGPIQPSATMPVSSTSSITQVVVTATAGPISSSESTRPQGALTNSNSISSIPGEQGPAAVKDTTRKRKAQEGTTKKPKRRKGTPAEDAEDIENTQEGPPKKAHSRASSRASSGTPKPRKRAPSAPPYDPDADPGEELDPTTVTMAALCEDTGQGRVSRKAAEILSNHAAWKIKNREKRARMKQIMEAKKYGREEELEDEENGPRNETQAEPSEAGPSTSTAIVDDTGSVRIGPNGETIIDEESLVVDRAENDGTENYTHVVESDQTKFVNSGTYGKRYRGSRWSAEETELFYDALAQYGENYELIAYVLPGRDRKSCKNKFKVEDKRNPARINHCLDNSIPVGLFGPVPEIRTPAPIPPPPAANADTSSTAPAETSPKVRNAVVVEVATLLRVALLYW